jgi:hypothetical protein
MRIKFSYIILVIILIVLLFITLSGSCSLYVPYTESNGINNYLFNYEGMNNMDVPLDSSDFLSKIANTNDTSSIKSTGINVSSFGSEKKIDIFSGTPGSMNCDNISSNLTNSKGGLCLNKEQKYMLSTRGGNASGGDFQIGK